MSIRFTNEEFLQKLEDLGIKYIPLEEYKGCEVKIKWLCYKDVSHIFEAKPSHIFDNHGCPYCSGRRPIKGKTDLWTTHPKIASMLLNSDEGHEYSAGSHHKTDWVCPNCGTAIKDKTIKNVVKQGLSCSFCSDAVSYPEKFISEMLRQLKVDYIFNRATEWSNNKRYDFNIKDKSLIIESHGEQHYDDFNLRNYNVKTRTLEEEKENDAYKMKLALDNGVQKYIVLDCRVSDAEFVKNSILNSDLNGIFDLSCVDWNKCHMATFDSITMDICNLWNDGLHYVNKIANIVGIGRGAVIRRLKLCSELGLCDYKIGASIGQTLSENKNRKRVLCVETGKVYESITSVQSDGYTPSKVSNCCHKRQKTYKELHWEFI